MLVLTRKRDEAILIGDNVRIVVIDTRGDRVRLGIEAAPEIPIMREELRKASDSFHGEFVGAY